MSSARLAEAWPLTVVAPGDGGVDLQIDRVSVLGDLVARVTTASSWRTTPSLLSDAASASCPIRFASVASIDGTAPSRPQVTMAVHGLGQACRIERIGIVLIRQTRRRFRKPWIGRIRR